jgi:hypothetical protein
LIPCKWKPQKLFVSRISSGTKIHDWKAESARDKVQRKPRKGFFFWGTWGAGGHSKMLLLHHHDITKNWRCVSHSTARAIQPLGKLTLFHRTKRYLLRVQKQKKT